MAKAIDLNDFSAFMAHPWVKSLEPRLEKDSILAEHAMIRLLKDLRALNDEHVDEHGRVLFSNLEGRVKTRESFFRKLQQNARRTGARRGLTQETLKKLYPQVRDLCGVRFSCPYFDDIHPAVEELVRPRLASLGYATELKSRDLEDQNFLEDGDEHGYRSFHFYVKVPTPTDIYGNSKLCLCEVQARSELQHVWAVKSHDLLYKKGRWRFPTHVVEDMKQLSHRLRAADQSLVSIRDRLREQSGAPPDDQDRET